MMEERETYYELYDNDGYPVIDGTYEKCKKNLNLYPVEERLGARIYRVVVYEERVL